MEFEEGCCVSSQDPSTFSSSNYFQELGAGRPLVPFSMGLSYKRYRSSSIQQIGANV
jgi:hypothetical protein